MAVTKKKRSGVMADLDRLVCLSPARGRYRLGTFWAWDGFRPNSGRIRFLAAHVALHEKGKMLAGNPAGLGGLRDMSFVHGQLRL